MSPSPHDPLSEPPRTRIDRLRHRARLILEPLATRLVDWCRSLEVRVGGVERKVGSLEGHAISLGDRVDSAEQIAHRVIQAERALAGLADSFDQLEARAAGLEARAGALESRADRGEWGREALVDRLNAIDARDEAVTAGLAGLDRRVEASHWGREALVERLNAVDAREEAMTFRIEAIARQITNEMPLPLSISMDALAMGRRLAALEDQVEALLTRSEEADSGKRPPSLVAFPSDERAAG